MPTDLVAKASRLSERMLIGSAKKLVAARDKCTQEEHAFLVNMKAYLKLNGSGAASRLALECGFSRARLSEVVNAQRIVPGYMVERIAGLK